MLPLLFAFASLIWVILKVHEAGWSLRRADRRGVYWGMVGLALGVTVACRTLLPASLILPAIAALSTAFLYGLIADRQGWWRT